MNSASSFTTRTEQAEITLHPGQSDLWDVAERSKTTIAVLGRRWGKTFFGAVYAYDRMTREHDPVDEVAWVTPSHDLGRIAWDEFHRQFGPAIARSHKTERWIQLRGNGSRMLWRSADNPVSIRGRGYGLMIADEGAWIPKGTYENAMLPTLLDRDGDLLAFTTPGGMRGWLYEEFQLARHEEPGYGWLQRPSTDNPNPAIQQWIARRRDKMTPAVYDQEILALFVEDAAALFRGLESCIGGHLEPPQPDGSYVAGIDLAKTRDWTVADVLRLDVSPQRLVAQDRFHRVDWPDQVARVAALCDRYNKAPAVVDATAVGDPVVGMMRDAGMSVHGFVFTTKSRRELLDGLAVKVANRAIRIPKALMDDVLGEEMRSMMVDLDDEGRTKYRSRGEFDDCVFALALACYGAPAEDTSTMVHGEIAEYEDESIMGEEF